MGRKEKYCYHFEEFVRVDKGTGENPF